MSAIVSVRAVHKAYASGFEALKGVDLEIEEGEILALLGPNGAGKTTLISTICGISQQSSGEVKVGGFDTLEEYRKTRSLIGLVPQEIALEPFGKVRNTVRLSRGLFGKPKDDALVERILKKLSLWDKRDSQISHLSGGMKRRVLIAKALVHEPKVLFLDEPSAGVDVELRQDMWEIVKQLRTEGVTIILTTHYIEEAEAIADRIGVISAGKILLVEEKESLMRRMGQKTLSVDLEAPIGDVPDILKGYDLQLDETRQKIRYTFDSAAPRTGIAGLIRSLTDAGLVISDVSTGQSSLEEIFVDLVKEDAA